MDVNGHPRVSTASVEVGEAEYVCLSVRLLDCLSACLPACIPVRLSGCLSSSCLVAWLVLYLNISMPVCQRE